MIMNPAVSHALAQILRQLSQTPCLNAFALGGGTSLALRFPFRISLDADYFTETPFNSDELLLEIRTHFSQVDLVNKTKGSLCSLISGIKVEFFHHPYPRLMPTDELEGLNLLSIADVAAMKVNAVTNRGSKKDFSDLYMLESNSFTLAQSVDSFCQKYGESSRLLALRSLAWFEDAEHEPSPHYLTEISWSQIRQTMQDRVRKLIGS